MNMLNSLHLRGMVSNENGEPTTTSYAVADAFGKRHSNVLRDIKRLIKKCDKDFEKNFIISFKFSELQNGKPIKFYHMTKDGFMLLVMGYTGLKAVQIKIAHELFCSASTSA